MSDPRTLWVYDTFEGLPPATDEDPESAQLYTGKCRGDIEDVIAMFQKVGVLDRAKLVKGLVQDTLPVSQAKTISVLHVDTDWYDSVRDCLVYLYDRVTPGGFIQIDDYGYWEGARKAVDEFLRNRGIDVKLKRLDYTGRQFVKPA
jgi:O-methyltransferase